MQQNLLVYFRPKTDSFVEVGVNLNRISDQVKRIPYTVSNPQISNWTKRGVCPPGFCLKTLTLRQLCVNLVFVNCEEVDFVTDRFSMRFRSCHSWNGDSSKLANLVPDRPQLRHATVPLCLA